MLIPYTWEEQLFEVLPIIFLVFAYPNNASPCIKIQHPASWTETDGSSHPSDPGAWLISILNTTDPATGEDLPLPTVHSAEEFIAILEGKNKSDPGFDLNNVEIVFDSDVQPVIIRRNYVVWQ